MHRTKVEQLIIKNDYDGHNNDIALLKVAKMKFSSKVYPACLPTSTSDYTKKKGEDALTTLTFCCKVVRCAGTSRGGWGEDFITLLPLNIFKI